MKFPVSILSILAVVGIVNGWPASDPPAIKVEYKDGYVKYFHYTECIPYRWKGSLIKTATILRSSTCYTRQNLKCENNALSIPLPLPGALGIIPIPNAADFEELIGESVVCYQDELPQLP